MNAILTIGAVTIVILLAMIAYDYAKSPRPKASLSKYSFASDYAAYKPISQAEHHKTKRRTRRTL